MSWIGVDLDGTLAMHPDPETPWPDIGRPVPRMVERVKAWLAEGREVRIMTARVSGQASRPAYVSAQRFAIMDWCEQHLGQRLDVTNEKDYDMISLYDDRAVQVMPNTGMTRDEHRDELIMKFTPGRT